MKQHPDDFMAELHRLLDKQEFKSEKEVQEFMNGIMEKGMPSFAPEEWSDKENAQEMVLAAYEQAPGKAKECIEAALFLDPDCIEAYEFLGDVEDSLLISIVFYEKAIAIGRKVFGGEFLKKHKGMFWGVYETRSFMRCLLHQAEFLHVMGKVKESVAILEEMIELNHNDNQGVRDQLLLFLTQLGETKKFKKYDKMFEHDGFSATCFNRALFAFKTEGENENSNSLLSQADKQNKFIAKRLLSSKPITALPDGFALGSKEEADCYVNFAKVVWSETEGALEWLKERTAAAKRK